MYNFSKDYDLMYQYLVEGNDIFCLVDYNLYNDGGEVTHIRSVCMCKRHSENDITFSVRGYSYGGVSPYFIDDNNNELKLFKAECKRLNCEFVAP